MTPAHTQLENKIDKPFERDVGLADEYKLFFLRASHEKYSEAPRGARPAQAPAAQLAGPRRAFGAPAQPAAPPGPVRAVVGWARGGSGAAVTEFGE